MSFRLILDGEEAASLAPGVDVQVTVSCTKSRAAVLRRATEAGPSRLVRLVEGPGARALAWLARREVVQVRAWLRGEPLFSIACVTRLPGRKSEIECVAFVTHDDALTLVVRSNEAEEIEATLETRPVEPRRDGLMRMTVQVDRGGVIERLEHTAATGRAFAWLDVPHRPGFSVHGFESANLVSWDLPRAAWRIEMHVDLGSAASR